MKSMDYVRRAVRKLTNDRQRSQLKAARSFFRRIRGALTPAAQKNVLLRDLRRAGILPGDVVMVHSSLSSLKHVEGGAEAVIAALQEAVTPSGTIMMPAYGVAEEAFALAREGQCVDLRTLAVQNGKIPSVFARTPGVLRSSHPFSSICAWGANAQFITEGHALDPRMAHKDSPLGRLLSLRGKVLGIGVSMGPISFYHVIEDTTDDFPLPVYVPAESITYIDQHGSTITREVARYDRAVTKRRIDNDDGLAVRAFMERHLRRRNIRHDFMLSEAPAFWIDAPRFYDELLSLSRQGVTIYSGQEAVHGYERQAADQIGVGIRPRTKPRGNV